MNNSHRVIFHVDMNSYFASCEQQANPHLRGRPVGVCEHLGGIIIAPSVEAKRLGIKTAMPVWEAEKRCPDIILLPVDPPKYRAITRKFLQIFSEYTDLVERYSIDEAFLDVTDCVRGRRRDESQTPSTPSLSKGKERGDEAFLDMTDVSNSKIALACHSELEPTSPKWLRRLNSESTHKSEDPDFRQDDDRQIWRNALMLALEIKWRVRQEVGEWLTCSVGAAENKLLAKIASDMDKPDGAVVIKPADVAGLYERLRLTDIPGIGNQIQRQLHLLGIFSLQDLAAYPESLLRAHFGILGHALSEMGNFRSSNILELDGDQIEEIEPRSSFLHTEAKSAEAYPSSLRATADDPLNFHLRSCDLRYKRRGIKSVGHAYTMPRATSDPLGVKKLLFKLSEKAAARLRHQNFWGSEISCYCRFATSPDLRSPSPRSERGGVRLGSSRKESYFGVGKSHRIRDFTNDGKAIFKQAWKIFQSLHIKSPVRMAGVTVSGLAENVLDEPLFARYKKPQWALEAQDSINGKYGDFTLRPAALIDAQNLAP